MKPLVPEDLLRRNGNASRERGIRSLVRVALCIGRNGGLSRAEQPAAAARLLAKSWPNDTTASYLVRAATTPASLTNTTAITQTIIADFLAALGPQSAGVQLLERGLQLSFDEAAVISLPSFVADQNSVAFVQEGAPIPVRQFAITTPVPQLVPRKLALITSLTNEMLASSHAEQFVRDLLLRNTALGLDKFLFDAQPADAARPAGLRYGIAALTASNATDLHEAAVEDITALLNAVSAVGNDIYLVASPARARIAQLRAQGGPLPPILGSAAINAADMIAVAADALASATDAAPEISASREAGSIHMDSAAGEIVSSPGVVAYPVASVFQTDRIALKLRFNADWLVRDSRAVAWLTTRW